MNMEKIQLAIVLFTLSIGGLYAQEDTNQKAPKHVLYGSIGSAYVVTTGTIGYDFKLYEPDSGFFKSYYATSQVGYSYIDGIIGDDIHAIGISLGATGLTGKGKNHFELGLGGIYYFDVGESNGEIENSIYPRITLGYRYQDTKGFVFRSGVSTTEWLYVGFGFSF